jgi:hypothetical protein
MVVTRIPVFQLISFDANRQRKWLLRGVFEAFVLVKSYCSRLRCSFQMLLRKVNQTAKQSDSASETASALHSFEGGISLE